MAAADASGDRAVADPRIPVTLLTGFLGSGKTTTLNHVLRKCAPTRRIAVIENEVGMEFGLESALVVGASDALEPTWTPVDDASAAAPARLGGATTTAAGAGGGDTAADATATEGSAPSASDLARGAAPSTASGVKGGVLVEEVVEFRELAGGCVCCSVRGELLRALDSIAVRPQAERPDHVVIETTGLANPQPVANVFFTAASKDAYRLSRCVTVVDAANFEASLDDPKPDGVRNEAEAQLALADTIIINKIDLVSEDDLARVEERVRKANSAAQVLRAVDGAVDAEALLSTSLFSLDDTIEKEPSFLKLEHHFHDESIVTVGATHPGSLNERALRDLLKRYLVDARTAPAPAGGGDSGDDAEMTAPTGSGSGAGGGVVTPATPRCDVLRAKGVFSLVGHPTRVVLQGVRDRYELLSGAPWAESDKRKNRLVLIGKGLDRSVVEADFKRCFAMRGVS